MKNKELEFNFDGLDYLANVDYEMYDEDYSHPHTVFIRDFKLFVYNEDIEDVVETMLEGKQKEDWKDFLSEMILKEEMDGMNESA